MKVWVWPFNWYCRFRELERENAALRQMNREMELRLRAQTVAETAMMVAYTSSLIAIAETYAQMPRR